MYLFLLLCLLPSKVDAEAIHDPIAHYLANTKHSPDDNLLSFVATFGANNEFLFISLETLVNGKAGNIWEAYAIRDGEYEPLTESVSLRRDALTLAPVEGLEGNALVTYFPDNAERGLLQAFQIDDGKIAFHDMGEIEPSGKDEAFYSEIFSSPTKISIQSQLVSEAGKVFMSSLIPANKQPLKIQPRPRLNSPSVVSLTVPITNLSQPDSEATHLQARRKSWIYYAFIGLVLGAFVWLGFTKFSGAR